MAFADPIDSTYGEAPRCPACGRFLGLKPWLPSYRIRLVEGTKTRAPGDVISGPGVSPENFIASDRFVSGFREARLTGVERWEPVAIEGYSDYEGDLIAGGPVDGRYRAAFLPVPRTRVKIDQMNPTFEGPADCPVCAQVRILDSYSGVVVDEESWSGHDIVRLTNHERLIVTDRFAEFFAAGEFTGARVVPAATYEPAYTLRSWER